MTAKATGYPNRHSEDGRTGVNAQKKGGGRKTKFENVTKGGKSEQEKQIENQTDFDREK